MNNTSPNTTDLWVVVEDGGYGPPTMEGTQTYPTKELCKAAIHPESEIEYPERLSDLLNILRDEHWARVHKGKALHLDFFQSDRFKKAHKNKEDWLDIRIKHLSRKELKERAMLDRFINSIKSSDIAQEMYYSILDTGKINIFLDNTDYAFTTAQFAVIKFKLPAIKWSNTIEE